MAKVILPCDLPLWPKAQELLVKLQRVAYVSEAIDLMLELHHLCNIAAFEERKEDEISVQKELRAFQFIVERQFSDVERDRFVSRTLPCLARFAVSLAELKPAANNGENLRISLRGSVSRANFDRRFVASIVANFFFSTFPRSSADRLDLRLMHDRVSFHALFGQLHASVNQAFRLRNFLNYFDILDEEEPWGHLMIERFSANDTNANNAEINDNNNNSNLLLTPIYVTHEPRCVDLYTQTSALCLKHHLPDLSNSPLILHPELLLLYLFMEDLAPNETVRISGLLQKTPKNANPDENAESLCLAHCGKCEESRKLKNFADFRRKIKQFGECFSKRRNVSYGIDARGEKCNKSSTISSKSSRLNRLAENLSLLQSSREVSPHSSQDSNKKRLVERRKSSFADRLKAALERGNTPDSEAQVIKSTSSFKKSPQKISTIEYANKKPPSSTSPSSGGSDSEYSFECGLNPDRMDTWIESAMLELTSKDDETANRVEIVKHYLRRNFQSGLTDSCLDIADRFETASKDHLTYHRMRNELKGLRRRRALSCLMDEERNRVRQFVPKKVQFDDERREAAGNYYAWSIDSASDPLEFLALWISVSLAELPLLVFQTNPNADLEQVFQVCSVIEAQRQKLDENGNSGNGNVRNLMRAVELFFENGIALSELSPFIANFYENSQLQHS